MLDVEGRDVHLLRNETGGHRFQRVPPNERRGRVHTSTVTVAVLDDAGPDDQEYPTSDFRVEWFSGSGKGGQHRNKHQNCARVTHAPTGLTRSAQTRSRESSYREAMDAVVHDLREAHRSRAATAARVEVATQVGSGQRGDKRRTYRERDDVVRDDRTGRSASYSVVMRGGFEALWG